MKKGKFNAMFADSNPCNTRKKLGDIKVSIPDKLEFLRTRILRESIHLVKSRGLSLSDAIIYIEEEMAKLEYTSETTRKLQTEEVITLENKYIDEDPRKSLKVITRNFTFKGVDFYVTPDFLYTDKAKVLHDDGTEEEVMLVEVVSMTTGRPKYTARSGLYTSIASLGLLMYGISVLDGKRGVVKVVFDALKTDKDKNGDFSRLWSEQKNEMSGTKADNRIYFNALVDKNGELMEYTSINGIRGKHYDQNLLMVNFEKSVAEFLIGKNDCKNSGLCTDCEYNILCNQAEALPKKEEKEESKMPEEVKLTREQQHVASYEDGIVVVCAGAGSGKSQSVSMRIMNLIRNGVNPEDILLLSFSTAAVSVLVARVDKIVNGIYKMGIDTSKIKIKTFNSIGNEVIDHYHKRLGFSEVPNLIDSIENYDLILEAIDWENPIEGYDYKNPHMNFNTIKGVGKIMEGYFRDIRDNNISKDDFVKSPTLEKVWETYERYTELLRKNNYIDYSDQSNLVKRLIDEDEYLISDMYDFQHIIVDEFQDSNDFQMLFVSCLTLAPKFRSLMVVGDDSQAIYGFRGTSPENIINFEDKIGLPCEDLYLSKNFRSVEEIVQFGNSIISEILSRYGCLSKIMSAPRGPIGEMPTIKGFEKAKGEVAYTVDEIEKLISTGEAKPSEIVVISHNKSYLKTISKALSERGIASQYDMKEDLLKNSKVLSAIGLCEFIKTDTTKGLMEYLNEVYGNTFLEEDSELVNALIRENAESFKKVYVEMEEPEKLSYLLNLLSSIRSDDDAVYEAFLSRIKGKTGYTAHRLVDYITKFKIYESKEGAEKIGEYEAVSLVTAHSSKGKEWKVVFGSLSDFDKFHDVTEETWRLLYVLVTRAKDKLYLTSLKYNGKDETKEFRYPNKVFEKIRGLSTIKDITGEVE